MNTIKNTVSFFPDIRYPPDVLTGIVYSITRCTDSASYYTCIVHDNLSTLHSNIDPSELAAKGVVRAGL